MKELDHERLPDVQDSQDRERFERLVLPYMDAGYNLARWLLRNSHDAEDIAQEALLRALRFIGGFHCEDAPPWLLRIVRNTCYTWLGKNRPPDLLTEFDEEEHFQNTETPQALAIAAR